jgi:hypothetical protein
MGYLQLKHIENFPAQDILTIDRLWVDYSDGHFGWSVQKLIWQDVGGKLSADYETYRRFGERVGWRVNGSWLSYSDITFTLKALQGHLPWDIEVFWHWWTPNGLGWKMGCGGAYLLSHPSL